MNPEPEKDLLGENLRRALAASDEQVGRSYEEFLGRLKGQAARPRRPSPGWMAIAASLLVCTGVLAVILSSGATSKRQPPEAPLLAAAQEKKGKEPASPDLRGLRAEMGRLKEAISKATDPDERARIQAAIDNLQIEISRVRDGKSDKGALEVIEKGLKKGPSRIDELTKLLEKNPADGQAYAARAEEYLKTKRWEEGAKDARRATQLMPENAHAFWVLGQACRLLGQSEESDRAFQRAAQIDPKLSGEIDRYKRSSKKEEELTALTGKMKSTADPDERARMQMKAEALDRELKLLSQGDRTMVDIQEIERRLKEKPDDPVALSDRASWLLDHGKAELALKDLDRAIDLKPDFGLAYLKRAMARAMRGEFDLAWKDAKRGENLDPKDLKVVELTNGTIKKLQGAKRDSQRSVPDLKEEIAALEDRLAELRAMAASADLAATDRQRAAKEASRVEAEIDRLKAELGSRPPESEPPPKKLDKKK